MSAALGGGGALAALTSLRQRDPGCCLVGRFCATLASQMLAVAVGWHVYALTRDPLALGLVGLSEFLPFVLLVLVGGHVADSVARRSVVLCAYVVEIGCALSLLWLAAFDEHRTWPIYVTLGVFGATRAFWGPAMQAMLPGLVPREQFAGTIALNSMLYQIGTVIGPVIGGLLYLAGAPVVYGTCAVLYAGAFVLMLMIRADTRPVAPPDAGGGRRVLEGLKFVRHNRLLLGVISLDLFAVLLGGAVALLPVYAKDILHVGATGLGWLAAAPAIGAVSMAMVQARARPHAHAGYTFMWAIALFGLATIVFGLSRWYWLSMIALVVVGAADNIGAVIRQTAVQLYTPDALRGRVSAVNRVFISSSNELGAVESGLLASLTHPVFAVAAGGVAVLAVAACGFRVFPDLRKLKTVGG